MIREYHDITWTHLVKVKRLIQLRFLLIKVGKKIVFLFIDIALSIDVISVFFLKTKVSLVIFSNSRSVFFYFFIAL